MGRRGCDCVASSSIGRDPGRDIPSLSLFFLSSLAEERKKEGAAQSCGDTSFYDSGARRSADAEFSFATGLRYCKPQWWNVTNFPLRRSSTRASKWASDMKKKKKREKRKERKKAFAYVLFFFFFLCELTPRQRAREAQKLLWFLREQSARSRDALFREREPFGSQENVDVANRCFEGS